MCFDADLGGSGGRGLEEVLYGAGPGVTVRTPPRPSAQGVLGKRGVRVDARDRNVYDVWHGMYSACKSPSIPTGSYRQVFSSHATV